MPYFLILLIFVVSCGIEKRQKPDVDPTANILKVGYEAEYLLDPTQSSKVISSGRLVALITDRTDSEIKFQMKGSVKTDFGSKPIDMMSSIPLALLNEEFLIKLRLEKTFDTPAFKLRYQKQVEKCDLIRTIDIKGYEWVQIDGLFCSETKNVIKMTANFSFIGQNIKALFLLKN